MPASGHCRKNDQPSQGRNRDAQEPDPPKSLGAEDGPEDMKGREADDSRRLKHVWARASYQEHGRLARCLVRCSGNLIAKPWPDGWKKREQGKAQRERYQIGSEKLLCVLHPACKNGQQNRCLHKPEEHVVALVRQDRKSVV